MIVVKVELWPRGYEGKARELVRMYVTNDGTGTSSHGNYRVDVMRRGETRPPWKAKAIRTGHARMSLHVLFLIRKAIEACFPRAVGNTDR